MFFYFSLNISVCKCVGMFITLKRKVYVINTYRSLAHLQDLIFQHFQDNAFSFNLETNISASKTKTYYLSGSKKCSPPTLINSDLDFP